MENPENKASIFKKMALVMGDLQRVPKSGYNKQQNYPFATAEDVKDAVRQAFAKHNLALLIEMAEYEVLEITSKNGNVGTKLRGVIEYSICCGDTGQVITRRLPAEAEDWQDKAFSKLYTIGLKYFLIDTFMMSTGDEPDPDGQEAEKITAQKPVQRKQPANPQPKNGNGKQPAMNAAQSKLWAQISAATDYYDNVFHALKAVGNPPLNKPDEWPQIVADAVDYARHKKAGALSDDEFNQEPPLFPEEMKEPDPSYKEA